MWVEDIMPDVKPIVAVVVPLFNYKDKIERAINSVKAQTLTNFSCIIVDDGSTDDPKETVEALIAGDDRFRFIQKPNGGVATARNLGVFTSTTPYVCCLDADDAIAPEFLEACVRALEEDPSLAIAYTGLWYIRKDGQEGLSEWPGQWNFDAQLRVENQISTCNVARREAWERLGGQRQRFCPEGAGEEDAELWLRAGAYGFKARKVTDAGLFLYSFLSGRVSGDRMHRPTDYMAWHPWVKDGKHPFASYATPKRASHPVRQYDRPLISVIIPVSDAHARNRMYINALDSLDAQTFRNWEAIVVFDTDYKDERLMIEYSYARLSKIDKSPKGAGMARNQGAELARGKFLIFLDADDWLMPHALEMMLRGWANEEAIIYTDYVSKSVIDENMADELKLSNKLLDYDEKTGMAAIDSHTLNYEYERAIKQPHPDLYIWNLVTCLVPKAWHNAIGGFDENMPSWEDWDYYIRMARAGYCFRRVPMRLVIYRFYSGERREKGIQEHKSLIEYMLNKYAKEGVKMCECSQSSPTINIPQNVERSEQMKGAQVQAMSDDNFVMIVYQPMNTGMHRVVGQASGYDYGYRGSGEPFLVDARDAALYPEVFIIMEAPKTETPPENSVPQAVQPEPPTPVKIDEELKELKEIIPEPENFLDSVSGLTPASKSALIEHGVTTASKVRAVGVAGLRQIKGIGPKRALEIYGRAVSYVG